MKTRTQFPEGGYLPVEFSPVDLFDENFRDVKVHLVTL